ncbi:MAG: hypothetical protein KDA61_20545 [Planctomycetales bacterium]|nr:hypothetical protein [Planctomycetales bacterium]
MHLRTAIRERRNAALTHLFACAVAWTSLLPGGSARADGLDVWNSLPAQTLGAVRIPDGAAFSEALTENTRLGKLVASPKRHQAIAEWLLALSDEDADSEDEPADEKKPHSLREALETYGFELADVVKLFRGDSGYAVVLGDPVSEADASLLVHGVGWASPGAELADRLFTVIERIVEDASDDEHPTVRINVSVGPYEAMQIEAAEVFHEYGDFNLPDDYQDLSEEEQEQAYERASQEYYDSAEEVIKHTTVVILKADGRLLLGQTWPRSDDEGHEADAEQLLSLLTRIVEGADDDGFAAKVNASPAAAPLHQMAGAAAFACWINLKGLLDVSLQQSAANDEERTSERLAAIGFDQLGIAGLQITIDQHRLLQRLSLDAPSPRRGIVGWLDQERTAFEPPAWAPAQALAYAQFQFDAAKAVASLKELMLATGGELPAQQIEMAETQFRAFAQAEFTDALASLGKQHMIVRYPSLPASDDGGEEESSSQARQAYVWKLSDEAILAGLLKNMGMLAAASPGVTAAEEQGYTGYRFEREAGEGGVMLGKGWLVVALGEGALEETLAVLNAPPQGDASLRGSELYRHAGELIELRPCIGFELSDGKRNMEQSLKTLAEWMDYDADEYDDEEGYSDDEEESDRSFKALVAKILPTTEEAQTAFGVSASLWEVTDDGLLLDAVTELP